MLHVVIPAFNERPQLSHLLERLIAKLEKHRIQSNIVVIDDGSTDGMQETLQAAGLSSRITVLNHPVNRGVSAAFRTGFDHVLSNAAEQDLILTLEANRSIDLDIIPAMLELVKTGADLVLASCYAPGGRVVGDPWLRLLLSIGANKMLKLFFPFQNIHTYTSFYRLWRTSIVSTIGKQTGGRFFDREGFACMADMLIKAIRLPGIQVQEVPLVLVSDIESSGSKMKVFRTVRTYVQLIWSNMK